MWIALKKENFNDYTDGELVTFTEKKLLIFNQNVKKISSCKNNKEIIEINNNKFINDNNKQKFLNLSNDEKEIIERQINKYGRIKTFAAKNQVSLISCEIAQFSAVSPQLPPLYNENNLKKKGKENSIINNTIYTFCDKKHNLQTNKSLNLSKTIPLLSTAPLTTKNESLIIKTNFKNIIKHQSHLITRFKDFF